MQANSDLLMSPVAPGKVVKRADKEEVTPVHRTGESVVYMLYSGSTYLRQMTSADMRDNMPGKGIFLYLEDLLSKCHLSLDVGLKKGGTQVLPFRTKVEFDVAFSPLCVVEAPRQWRGRVSLDTLYPVYMNRQKCTRSHADDGDCHCPGTGSEKNKAEVAANCVKVLIPALQKMKNARTEKSTSKTTNVVVDLTVSVLFQFA
jgi:hypothetical protein